MLFFQVMRNLSINFELTAINLSFKKWLTLNNLWCETTLDVWILK